MSSKQQKPSVLPLTDQHDPDPSAWAIHVANWMAAIARLLDYCCEKEPGHILWLRDMIAEASLYQHNIKTVSRQYD